jgi:large subunit ribosomal protein L14
MIQQQTLLRVADNSGAKTAKCIKILGGYKKKYAKLGDIIVVTIKKLRNKSKFTAKVKKGEVYKALIIRTKINTNKKDGSKTFFYKKDIYNNSITLINKKSLPIATRINEPTSFFLKKKQFIKFTSISTGLL